MSCGASLETRPKVSGMQLQLMAIRIEEVEGIVIFRLLPAHNAYGPKPFHQDWQR